MAKYDSLITELKNLLPAAKSILIALPGGADIDKLAAGLSLFLNLEAAGKQVSIACDDNMLVDQANLFGVDHVQKNLPSTEGGNLTLTLEGVAASDGTVPALEKLDWYADSSNLNLVFHVLPGQTFQPAKIVPRYQGSGFNLIFTIGAVNLNALGNLYQANSQVFSGTHIVNIDTNVANTSFGQTNVLDPQASSICEIMTNLISDLGYNLDADSASNLLAGIFASTGNLSNSKVTADTYMAVANCLRVGGRKPSLESRPQVSPQQDLSSLIPKQDPTPIPGFAVPQVDVGDHSLPLAQASQSSILTPNQSVPTTPSGSPEERPAGEGVISETVEPEWLTPKIFKGTSLG